MAESMMGDEKQIIRLPVNERPVIRLAMATVGKWRVAVHWNGKVKLLGFDLGEIDVARRWLRIRKDAHLLEGIGIIERAALKVLDVK